MNKNFQKIPLFDKLKTKARAAYKSKKIGDAVALRLYYRKKQEGSK